MTTADVSENLPRWRRFVMVGAGFMGPFAGLCTVFALVVTVAEGWVEQGQAQWPQATARIQRCGVDIFTHNPESYWIDCSLSYTVRGREILSHVHSLTRPAPQRFVYQYPPGQFERWQEWVDEHRRDAAHGALRSCESQEGSSGND